MDNEYICALTKTFPGSATVCMDELTLLGEGLPAVVLALISKNIPSPIVFSTLTICLANSNVYKRLCSVAYSW